MKKAYFIANDGIESAKYIDRDAVVYCEYGEHNVNALHRAGFSNVIQLRYKNRSKPIKNDIFLSRQTRLPVWDTGKYDIVVIEGKHSKLNRLLGEFPRQQELADYLGVNKATVSGYPKGKKDLMLHGLWLKKALGDL